jgi:hypothetical protein
MDRLLQYYKDTYFSDVLAVIVAIIGITIYYRKKRDPSLKLFTYYLASYCLMTATIWAYRIVTRIEEGSTFLTIMTYWDYCFTVFEFFVLYRYISLTYHHKLFNFLKILFSSTALLLFILSHFHEGILTRHYLYLLFNSQALCILPTTIYLLYRLMIIPPNFELGQQPLFWIASGFAFLTITTLPYSTMLTLNVYTKTLEVLFSVFNVFYALLFMSIIKAFVCKNSISHS